ncbi:MAG: hypothetical protein EON56_04370 [Alphaproteobacteria bacterium]|nr:MAG: hypothetical protein EON56_04370 [Alphaproteobacteria bacterium]
MSGFDVVIFFAAVCGIIACTTWFRTVGALDQHGALDARFKSSFTHAAVSTALCLGLGSTGIMLRLLVV